MENNHISSTLYKDDFGNPMILTPTQQEIFDIITQKKHNRVQVITPTQYGKSMVVSMAVDLRAATFPEKWAIIAPSKRKAEIIMGHCIDNIFDNPYLQEKFLIDKSDSYDRIRRKRSQDRINFKVSEGRLGEIFTISTEGKRVKNVLDAVMGFGAPNIILDESSLITDEQYAGVLRMLGQSKDNFLLEIGNPFRRNHFYETTKDKKYRHIWIDYKTALKEGRFSQDFIEEMRSKKFFDVLYGCQFPLEGTIDESGWMKLLLDKDIKEAIIEERPYPVGIPRLGVDPAGGGRNYTSMVLRFDNYAEVVYKANEKDLTRVVEKMFEICDTVRRMPGVGQHPMCFIDANGVGKGVYDMAKRNRPGYVYGIIAGEAANQRNEFINRRAEYYWKVREAILSGLKLVADEDWMRELPEIKYMVQSEKKVKIMSKEEMLVSGIESPDTADALALTYSVFPEKITAEVYYDIEAEGMNLDPY